MKQDIVSFETAKLAKEKGFDEDTSHIYPEWQEEQPNEAPLSCEQIGYPCSTEQMERESMMEIGYGDFFKAPTQDLLQKWLREKKNIEMEIKIMGGSRLKRKLYEAFICPYNEKGNIDKYGEMEPELHGFESYYEAREAGLQVCLELLKDHQ